MVELEISGNRLLIYKICCLYLLKVDLAVGGIVVELNALYT